ncbi:MAG: sensor histidine kinase [Candidatus Ventricola sp.]
MKVYQKKRRMAVSGRASRQLAALAHDLRVPMRCVAGAAQTAMSASRRGQAVDEQLRQILLSVQSMERILAQLVDIPEGRQDAWFNGDMLARELHAMADGPAACKAQTLHIDLSALRAQPMEADYGALTRVLTNLVSNAIQYTPGGGRIALTGQLERQGSGAQAVFTVEDNGVGMEPAFIERMYQPFVRARESARRPGCGLGLAIVRRLVERMHGEIDVRSAPGVGTTFIVRVPVIACKCGLQIQRGYDKMMQGNAHT